MSSPKLSNLPAAINWIVPRQRVLFYLLTFLIGSFFLRTIFFISNSPNRFYELGGLLPIAPKFHLNNRSFASSETSKSDRIRKQQPPSDTVSKFVRYEHHQGFKSSQKHQIEMCVIAGNQPDFFTAFMCFIHDPAKFKEAKRFIHEETAENRLCKGLNEGDKFRFVSSSSNNTDGGKRWLHLAAVRNPIERFVSSFNRLCVKKIDRCGKCGDNLTCLLETEYTKMLKYSKSPETVKLSEVDMEFMPQNWYCEFSRHLDEYKLLKIESKDEASMKLFNAMFFQCREQGVENDDLTFIYKQINEPLDVSENITVEEAVLESRLRGNVQAMRLLIRIYYQDFELFGFEFPSVEGEK